MQISSEQLKKIFPTSKAKFDVLAPLFNKYFEKYEINTKARIAMFLAQAGHESMQFGVMVENLNYSAEGLLKIFPKYFNSNLAQQYAKKPEKIANRVYGNRMSNGDEASGDGFKHRGRGFIQITGKANYMRLAGALGLSVDDTIKYLETAEGAVESACWFFKFAGIFPAADGGNVVVATKKINGGTIGLTERTELYKKALSVL